MLLIVARSTRYGESAVPQPRHSHLKGFARRKKGRLLHSSTLLMQGCGYCPTLHNTLRLGAGRCVVAFLWAWALRNRKTLDFIHWDNTSLQFLSRAFNTPCLNYWHDMRDLLALLCCRAHHAAPQADMAPSKPVGRSPTKTCEKCSLQSEKIHILASPLDWRLDSWRSFPI